MHTSCLYVIVIVYWLILTPIDGTDNCFTEISNDIDYMYTTDDFHLFFSILYVFIYSFG